MITLDELYQHLISSELSEHSIGTNLLNGSIDPKYYNRLIPTINLGIKTLYRQLVLQNKFVIIDLSPTISNYVLHSRHSYLNTTSPSTVPRYISDSIYMPFEDRIIKILNIKDEVGRDKYRDDIKNNWSLQVTDYNKIYHPYPDVENAIGITYQSYPKLIDKYDELNPVDPAEVELDIGDAIIPALCYFVGSRFHVNMSNQDSMVEANFFKNKYLEEIRDLEHTMVEIDIHSTDPSIRERGFF